MNSLSQVGTEDISVLTLFTDFLISFSICLVLGVGL